MADLYEWTINESVIRETDGMFPRSHDGHVFSPSTVKRSAIDGGTSLDAARVSVSAHRTHPVAAMFRSMPPSRSTLTIYRAGSSGYVRAWSGRLVNVRFAGSGATIDVEPRQTAMRLRGLNQSYAERCRHRLGDAGCQARDLDRLGGDGAGRLLLASVDGSRIELAGLADYIAYIHSIPKRAGQAFRWLVGGELSLGTRTRDAGPRRFILSQDGGDWLTLDAPFPPLAIGTPINVWAGCSHDIWDCRNKFENVANFGGFVFGPKVNPYLRILSSGAKNNK